MNEIDVTNQNAEPPVFDDEVELTEEVPDSEEPDSDGESEDQS